jgi:hypothetical protein
MNLLSAIEDNSSFGFTGKINILLKDSGQYKGVIYQRDGRIVQAEFEGQSGKKALVKSIVANQAQNNKYKFVLEPEVIDEAMISFSLDLEQLYEEVSEYIKNLDKVKSLKPPGTLKLLPKGEFIISGAEITKSEFDLLKLMTDYSTVNDLYEHSKMEDLEITLSIVALRKKGAIKVLS